MSTADAVSEVVTSKNPFCSRPIIIVHRKKQQYFYLLLCIVYTHTAQIYCDNIIVGKLYQNVTCQQDITFTNKQKSIWHFWRFLSSNIEFYEMLSVFVW